MLLFHSSEIEECNYSFSIFGLDVYIYMSGPNAFFQISDRFWVQQKINFSFQDKFFSLKAHAHYFTILIYLATWKAAKLGIFTHFTSINLPQCSKSIDSLMYLYYTDLHLFLWATDLSRDCTSSYYKTILHLVQCCLWRFNLIPRDNLYILLYIIFEGERN